MPTPADLWNYVLPDPYPNAQPKSAALLLGWAAAHAAAAKEQITMARAEAAGARAVVVELARQFAASDFDDEALIARMQQAVRDAIADTVHLNGTGSGRPTGTANDPDDPAP